MFVCCFYKGKRTFQKNQVSDLKGFPVERLVVHYTNKCDSLVFPSFFPLGCDPFQPTPEVLCVRIFLNITPIIWGGTPYMGLLRRHLTPPKVPYKGVLLGGTTSFLKKTYFPQGSKNMLNFPQNSLYGVLINISLPLD